MLRSSCPNAFCKKSVLRNCAKFAGKLLFQTLFFKTCNFIEKESRARVFSCQFYEISKNTFSYRTSPVTAPEC